MAWPEPLPPLNALPPSRAVQSGTDFSTAADAWDANIYTFFSALPAWQQGLILAYAQANYNATSASSVAIGTGTKLLTIDSGKLFVDGQFLIVAATANPANYMAGQVIDYNSTTGDLELEVPVGGTGGAGTFDDWQVSLSGPMGAQGPSGGAGTFLEKAGDTMAGPLVTAASAAGGAGFNLAPGVAPDTPNNGDIWPTASGLFARIAGVTLELLSKSGGVMTGALGLTSDSTVKDAAGTTHQIGYRGVPLDVQASTVTLALKHAGAGVKSTNIGAVDVNIPANATVPFPANETVIPIMNRGSTALTIKPAAGVTLYLAGSGATGNRSLAPFGMATLVKTGTDEWMISGAGLS